MRLKERIVVQVNRDDQRKAIREDCAAAVITVIRILLSIGTCLGFTFDGVDVKGD